MSEVQIAFDELFFGSGMFLGLVLYMAIIGLSSIKVKYLGVLYLPISLLLSIEYLNRGSESNNCFWGAIIMLISVPFLLFNLWKGKWLTVFSEVSF